MSDPRLYVPRPLRKRPAFVLLIAFLFLALVYNHWALYGSESLTWVGTAQNIFTPTAAERPARPPPVPVSPAKEEPPHSLHRYRDDGLLEVNPNGTHPIFELIEKAEAKWRSKLQQASETLEEAVEEYVKRYHRMPPKGFDQWWAYAKEHNVQLPDEYDSIYHKLEPFWGVNPVHLQKTLADYEQREADTVLIIGKVDGKLKLIRNTVKGDKHDEFDDRAKQELRKLKDVEHILPDFRAVYSLWDNPSLVMDWELTNEAIEAAAAHTFIDPEDLPPPKHGWVSACPPDSPAVLNTPDFKAALPVPLAHTGPKTFVHDHPRAIDPCLHPMTLRLVGQYISHFEGPGPQRDLIPQFSTCATPMHIDLVPPPPQGFGEEQKSAVRKWEDKNDERLLWRGMNTGIYHQDSVPWKQSQRVRLVSTANNMSGTIDVLLPPKAGEESKSVGEPVTWRRSRANPAIMDIAFVQKPIGCSEAACKELEDMFHWRKHMHLPEASQYKYVIDVDGNGWSSRFKRLVLSNTVVFKSTAYPEWFTDRIQPWVHYVPIQVDYSDLYDAFLFFRGDLNGEGSHDHLAQAIAAAGRKWAQEFWRKEDANAYMLRLLLEYSRIMSKDRDAMTYKSTP